MSAELPTRPFTRPTSEQLVDLHVYIVPKNSWNDKFRSAYNEVIHQTISCGFVRVWPELTIFNLRETIFEQLGDDSIPKDYVFLRSVGRCLTQVRSRQETTLKVKCFIPPLAYAPEIFILEAKHGSSSLSSSTTPHSLSDFGSSRIDSGHLSSNDERAQTNGSVEFNSEGHIMPQIRPAHSEKEPRLSRTTSGGKSASGKRKIYSNTTTEDSGISDEPIADGIDHVDYQRQMTDSFTGNEPTTSNTTSRNEASRQSDRQQESSRQSSRYSQRDQISRQSRQDESQELEQVPPLDLVTGLEDNGLGESMEEEQDVENQEEQEEDMEAEMEEIRKRQAEELRVSRMKSQEMSHSRGPPSAHASARDGSQSQLEEEQRISREQSRNEGDLLAVDQDVNGRLTQQTNTGDEEQGQEAEDQQWEADVAKEAMQELQLDEQQQEDEEEEEQEEEEDVDEEKDPLIEECKRLQNELEKARTNRIRLEQEREDLVKRAKSSQAATQEKRNKSRNEWKKKYFDEKKKTPPLEEHVSKLKTLVDQQYRKMLSHIEGRGKKGQSGPPSKKNDHKIAIFKTNHEMDDLQRKVENAQMRLASEIKLRNQAENELRNLRAEVMQRKIHVSLTRSQQNLHVVAEPAAQNSKSGKPSSRAPTRTPRNTPGRQSRTTKTSYKETTPRV